MSEQHKLAPRSNAAFAFPDLLEFGIEALLVLPPSEIARIAKRIDQQGFMRKGAKAKQAGHHAVLDVPVPLESGASYDVRVELFFEPAGDNRIRLSNRSSIRLNGLRLLRALLDMRDWPIGLDGQDNLAGPTSEHEAGLVDELLIVVGELVERAVDAIRAVMPKRYEVEDECMRLRKAELTHDLACADPTGVTLALGQSSFCGAIATMHDVYRQGMTSGAGFPVMKYRLSKSGIDLKVYGKTYELLRHEVSCLRRRSVVAITGAERDEIGGDTACKLVRSFVNGAAPLLAELLEHVQQVSTRRVSPATLLVELAPLVELILANDKWSVEAEAAWNAFVLTGFYDAKGKRKGTKLRDVLEALTGPDGPLQHGARQTVYHLHPRLVQGGSA